MLFGVLVELEGCTVDAAAEGLDAGVGLGPSTQADRGTGDQWISMSISLKPSANLWMLCERTNKPQQRVAVIVTSSPIAPREIGEG